MENLIELITAGTIYFYRVDSEKNRNLFATISTNKNISRLNPATYVNVQLAGNNDKTAMPFGKSKRFVNKAFNEFSNTSN